MYTYAMPVIQYYWIYLMKEVEIKWERERGERDSVCVYTSLRWVREERELRTIVYIRDCEESGGESACVLK